MKIKIPKLRLPQLKLDIDDALIIAGTISFTAGLYGYDPRAAAMALGLWLVFLGRPRGGD